MLYPLQPGPIDMLRFHPIDTIDRLHPRKTVLRVRNAHFTVLAVDCLTEKNESVFRPTSLLWRKGNSDDLSRYKEGIQAALYVLYVLNIPYGECIVQRKSAREYSVYKAESLSQDESDREMASDVDLPSTYGADVECLLQNVNTGGWVSASSITTENGTIGCDDTIAVNSKKVLRPILELRPEPAGNAQDLHRNLLCLHEKLEAFLKKNHLRAVTTGFGRFCIGGHLHVGNQPLTFESVRKLDLFLTLPFALTEQGNPHIRRSRFGRLGSVRPNRFNGFEYRSLPSWYAMIPDLLPLLEWFCYINEHPDDFPVLDFTPEILQSYYSHSIPGLREVSKEMEQICQDTLPSEDFAAFAAPFFRLIHTKSDVL
ncbi:MAG TPA: hypothetical protein VFK33_02335 [Bacillales bacterium]|nr:hypothetical protein [Bacillales bacterium]